MSMSLLCLILLLALVHDSTQWSGHYVSYVKVTGHKYVEWCDYHCWWHCCSHSHRTEDITTTDYRCAAMWKHNGDQNCNIPVCSPECSKREECVVKSSGAHVCQCKSGFVGPSCDCPDGKVGTHCEFVTCSSNDPCYPGDCHKGPSHVNCNCEQNFKGRTCLEVPGDWKATISNTGARMSFWQRGIAHSKEEYALEIYSTEKDTTKWTNMERFNWLNVSATALFNTETPAWPAYISNAGFGISDAHVKLKLLKLPVQGALSGKLDEKSLICNEHISYTTPSDLVECNINEPNFDWALENGDRLTIEFDVSTGGFRRLINVKSGVFQRTEHYTSNMVSTSVVYKFDFVKPTYTGSALEAFHTNNDFTKSPISLRWTGWSDVLSGMGRYTWEVFHLKPNGDGDLTEENKMRPIIHRGVNHTVPIVYPLPYTPKQPGMYSFILEAVDKANNSVYMRRCVLYDPESSVTTDSKHQMRFSSVHLDTEGHQWVSAPTNQLSATWTDHFVNYLHEKGKFLNRILQFSVQLVEGQDIYKRVDSVNDDHQGDRTVDAVPNKRGIVKFETAYIMNGSAGASSTDYKNWSPVSNLSTSQLVNTANQTSGSTLTFWVKAEDVLGNNKMDSTVVAFDFTKPNISLPTLKTNMRSNIPFSSKLTVPMMDSESGIDHIRVKISQLSDGYLLTNRTLQVKAIKPKDCVDKQGDCYCPGVLDVCYKRVSELYISNCWLMVSRNSLRTAQVRLVVEAVNRAGLATPAQSLTITNLTSLNGTEAYFGPMNVKVEKISQSGVRVTWNHAPSCYPRTFIWLSFDESGKMIKIHKDAKSYDLTDLTPGKKYTIKLQTDYGGIKSKEVSAKFRTLDKPGTSVAAIAGIVIGALLIVTVVVVGVVLWKTGKAAALMRRRRSRYQTRREARSPKVITSGPIPGRINNHLAAGNNAKGMVAYKNNAYDADDDIYMYGSMEFQTTPSWYMSKDNLTLLREIATGRFACVYKAKHLKKIVAAKTLKGDKTEDSVLLMTAKINFMATMVGEHPHVLGFHGAVFDNEALGPVLVMEYCENGQLDKWLTARQRNVDMDVLEKIQTFVLQIARGMDYLTQKGIAHRKLAVRNCLLTSRLEVKVAGFGPTRFEEESEDSKGDRIPVKWTAPECLQSLKEANEKSDVWSFGVTMWEIFSMGEVPYPDVRSRDLPSKIRNGHRLQRPEYAEDIHNDLMKNCWMLKPDQRPTFKTLLDKLETSFGLRPASGANYYYAR